MYATVCPNDARGCGGGQEQRNIFFGKLFLFLFVGHCLSNSIAHTREGERERKAARVSSNHYHYLCLAEPRTGTRRITNFHKKFIPLTSRRHSPCLYYVLFIHRNDASIVKILIKNTLTWLGCTCAAVVYNAYYTIHIYTDNIRYNNRE